MPGGQQGQRPVDVRRRHQRDHADAHVEGAVHLGLVDLAATLHQVEDRLGPPGAAVQRRRQVLRQHAGQVGRQPAPGDVAEAVHLGLLDQGQAVLGVDAGRDQQGLAQRAAQLVHDRRQPHPGALEQHVPHQREAVAVQATGGHRDHDVALAHPVRAEQLLGLDDPDSGAGDVVVVGRHQPRVLCGLATHQRAAGRLAAGRDATDDLGDPLRDDLPARDVVLQEQRLRTADHEVVDDHADQVDPDGVVLVQGLRDGELGADAVGAAGQQRVGVAGGVEPEQAGEPPEPADDLGAAGPGDAALHQLDSPVARVDVHAGCGIRAPVAHGRLSASSAPPPASSAFLGSAAARPSSTTTPPPATWSWSTDALMPSRTCLPIRSRCGISIG